MAPLQLSAVSLVLVTLFLFPCANGQPLESCVDQGLTVQTTTFQGGISKLLWSSDDTSLVYLLAMNHTLFISQNAGLSFQPLRYNGHNVLARSIALMADQQSLAMVTIGQAVYVYRPQQAAWYTNSFGEDMAVRIIVHPLEEGWIMTQAWVAACSGNFNVPQCQVDLHLSHNYGLHWQRVAQRVYSAEFAATDDDEKESILIVTTDRVDVSQYRVPTEQQKFQLIDPWTGEIHVEKEQISFVLASDYYNTTFFVSHENGHSEIMSSIDDGYTIAPLHFDNQVDLDQVRWTILKMGNVVFLNVLHDSDSSSGFVGDLYSSSSFQDSFTLVLPFNKRTLEGSVDFEEMPEMPASYIANAYDKGILESGNSTDYIMTMITQDEGGEWNRIPAPVPDCDRAHGACYLNLVGRTEDSNHQAMLAKSSAPGLVLANGNVGHYLRFDEVNTYLSRDGGSSFSLIMNGSHVFQHTNFGSFIIMTPTDHTAAEVRWTWNGGDSWQFCDHLRNTEYSDLAVFWERIHTDPKSASSVVLMEGVYENGGVLTHIDFSNVHARSCQGVEAAGSPESDYDLWRLGCVLGEETVVSVKKSDRRCVIPSDYEVYRRQTVCRCSRSDYECDGFCFRHNSATDECDNICVGYSYDPQVQPSDCSIAWRRTRGYRLIPETVCQGGLDLTAEIVACNVDETESWIDSDLDYYSTSDGDGSPGPKRCCVYHRLHSSEYQFRCEDPASRCSPASGWRSVSDEIVPECSSCRP